VKHAKSLTDNVEFSAEDGSRSDRDYLCRVFAAAIDAGATTVNLPDTVGYAIPEEFAALVRHICKHTPNIHKAILSVHCHDDLGLATANTLSAIHAGARQAEVTINGIGERAGNTSLEEVVMALHTAPTPEGAPASDRVHPPDQPSGQHDHRPLVRPTRPSSAPMPLPTKPASTRMDSQTPHDLRDRKPETIGPAPQSSSSANTRGATRLRSTSRTWATTSPTRS
jgi:hypothetical protein